MELKPPFFVLSQSRPNLVVAGVGSGTSDYWSRSRPKKGRLRNTELFLTYFSCITRQFSRHQVIFLRNYRYCIQKARSFVSLRVIVIDMSKLLRGLWPVIYLPYATVLRSRFFFWAAPAPDVRGHGADFGQIEPVKGNDQSKSFLDPF